MSWPPNASMPTTRPCRSWRRRRPAQAASGSMCATIGRSAARTRRRRFFEYSPSRHGEYPRKHLAGWSGVMQADAFAGYNELYDAARKPAPIARGGVLGARETQVLRLWRSSPRRRSRRGRAPHRRIVRDRARHQRQAARRAARAVRQERSKPLVVALEAFLREQRALLSPKNELAKAINYILDRWAAFTRFLDDGRICLSNNAAERALRGVAWTEQLDLRRIRRRRPSRGSRLYAHRDLQAQRCRSQPGSPSCSPNCPIIHARIDELMPWAWKARIEVAVDAPTAVSA